MDAPVALREDSRPALAVSQVTTLDALTIAIQHPVLVTDVQMVCSILQTCKTLRAVLQQSAGQLTIETSTEKLPRLRTCMFSKFAKWLPKHAGLVRSVGLWARRDNPSFDYSPIDNTMAVSFSAARPALRLKSFKADYIVSAEVLQALPAASLTQLHIGGSFYGQAHRLASNSSATVLALGQLSGLQDLSLNCAYHQDPLSSNVLAVVNMLSCLSRLHLSWMPADCSLQLLPQRLEQLSLSAHCGTKPLTLQHLTGLKHLELWLHGRPADGSGLPKALTGLDLSVVDNVATHVLQRQLGLQMLTRLQTLKASNLLEGQQDLKGLASLTNLSQLDLDYSKRQQAIGAAPGWKRLTSLHSLSISLGGQTLSDQEAGVLLAGLQGATTLTKLEIFTNAWIGDDAFFYDNVMLCQYLTDLKQLKHLTLDYCGGLSVQEAVLPIASLSSLTHLVVAGADGLNDVAATAIARRLQELRHLEIRHCGLTSIASFPAIGTLQQLTHLALLGKDIAGKQEQDIMLLTTLTGLKKLNVSGIFSADAINSFWVAVGGRPMD